MAYLGGIARRDAVEHIHVFAGLVGAESPRLGKLIFVHAGLPKLRHLFGRGFLSEKWQPPSRRAASKGKAKGKRA